MMKRRWTSLFTSETIPVNKIDPNGNEWQNWRPVSEPQLLSQMGWNSSDAASFLSSLFGVNFNSTLFWYARLFNPLDFQAVAWGALSNAISYTNPMLLVSVYSGSGGDDDPIAGKRNSHIRDQ
ncbi:MAG: hypothetical protein JXA73_01620 [Acidobacteria bacterium]|nr:hypothetical protein [Acidobacteriota bacterium]